MHELSCKPTEPMSPAARAMSVLSEPRWFVPHIVLIICQATFSMMHVLTADALDYIPPLPFAGLRVALALPLLWLVARNVETPPKFSASAIASFALLGVIGVAIPQGLIFTGIHLAGPDIVAIMQPTIPVYVAIISVLLGYEKPSLLKAVGVVCAISGAVVILDISSMSIQSRQSTGLVVMVLQTMSYASFLLVLSRVLKQHPYPFTVFAYVSTFGSAVLLSGSIGDLIHTDWGAVPGHAWGALVYAGIVVSFMAHGSTSWAVQHANALVPSLYTCLQPPLTTMLAALLLSEGLSAKDGVGLLLIVTGLFVTVKAKYDESSGAGTEKCCEIQMDEGNHGRAATPALVQGKEVKVSIGSAMRAESGESDDLQLLLPIVSGVDGDEDSGRLCVPRDNDSEEL